MNPKYWLIHFEDQDRPVVPFSDEESARSAFIKYSESWNCTLFGPAALIDSQQELIDRATERIIELEDSLEAARNCKPDTWEQLRASERPAHQHSSSAKAKALELALELAEDALVPFAELGKGSPYRNQSKACLKAAAALTTIREAKGCTALGSPQHTPGHFFKRRQTMNIVGVTTMRELFLVVANDHCTGSVKVWTWEATEEEADKYLRDIAPHHPGNAFWVQKAMVKDSET